MMIILDNQQWVENQFADCDLQDKRRTFRLQVIAKNMLAQPDGSLPQQNTDWADLKAAYRLFDRPEVRFESITTPHWEQTRQAKPGRYLLISDTTDIDLYTHQATTDLGILGDGKGRGIQLHSCLMFDCDRQQIVGQAGAIPYYRQHKPKNETRMQRLNRRRESSLWGELVDQVGPAPEQSQWIHVFDRGGDNFEAMCHIKQSGCDWVIRASKLSRKVIDQQGTETTLKKAAECAQQVGSYELHLRSRPGVAARTAKLTVSVSTVPVPRPSHASQRGRKCGSAQRTMNVVAVQEATTPTGGAPRPWVLRPSQPVETFEDAWQVLEASANRWMLEE